MPPPTGFALGQLVKRPRNPGDCWEWIGRRTEDGGGNKTFLGKTYPAARWVWLILMGPIPEGMVCFTTCGTPGCVNPFRLAIGTQAENARQGSNSKLLPEDVREIRRTMRDAGASANTVRHLATRYGCTTATIRDVVARRSWRKAAPFHGPNNPRNQHTKATGND